MNSQSNTPQGCAPLPHVLPLCFKCLWKKAMSILAKEGENKKILHVIPLSQET